jgi:hypothetical protein
MKAPHRCATNGRFSCPLLAHETCDITVKGCNTALSRYTASDWRASPKRGGQRELDFAPQETSVRIQHESLPGV